MQQKRPWNFWNVSTRKDKENVSEEPEKNEQQIERFKKKGYKHIPQNGYQIPFQKWHDVAIFTSNFNYFR